MRTPYESVSLNESFDSRIARAAGARYGVFTREEARRDGGTKRMIQKRITSGRWERLHPGVYRIVGSQSSWLQSLVAASLAWSGAVVSHLAAAALWEMPGFKPGVVEITTQRHCHQKHDAVVVHRTLDLPNFDIVRIRGIRVTSPTRTLIDIAGKVERDVLEVALDDLLRRRLTSLPKLRRRLKDLGGSGRRGTAVLTDLIAARIGSAIPESPLETKWLQAFRKAGLPDPICQFEIRDGERFVARTDFAWPRLRLAVEVDGLKSHFGERSWQRDRQRGNKLTLMGWRLIRVTSEDLKKRREAVIQQIRDALQP